MNYTQSITSDNNEESNPLISDTHSQKSVSLSENNLEVRKLTWDDFQGTPDKDDPALALTRWKIGYNYQVQNIEEKVIVTVDVWCKIDPSSWTKMKFQELLHHQQDHFYIGMICALEFKKRVQEQQFTKNYKEEISELFRRTLQEHLDLETQFDIETLNMLNTAKQRQWDVKILKMLNSLSKYSQ